MTAPMIKVAIDFAEQIVTDEKSTERTRTLASNILSVLKAGAEQPDRPRGAGRSKNGGKNIKPLPVAAVRAGLAAAPANGFDSVEIHFQMVEQEADLPLKKEEAIARIERTLSKQRKAFHRLNNGKWINKKEYNPKVVKLDEAI